MSTKNVTFPHVQCEVAQSTLPLYSSLCAYQVHVRNQKVLNAYTDRIYLLLHWKDTVCLPMQTDKDMLHWRPCAGKVNARLISCSLQPLQKDSKRLPFEQD